MTKRGVLLGAMALAGLHTGAFLMATENQRRKVAKFIQDYPAVFLGANVASVYVLGALFSGKTVDPKAISKLVVTMPREMADDIRADWAENLSSYLEITPVGDVYRLVHNCT